MNEVIVLGKGDSNIIGSLSFNIKRHPILSFFGLKLKKRTLNITPIKLGVRQKYAHTIKDFYDHFEDKRLSVHKLDHILSVMSIDNLVLALSYVITNSEKKPKKWLLKALRKMDNNEFESIVFLCDRAIDHYSFLTSIINLIGQSLPLEEEITTQD